MRRKKNKKDKLCPVCKKNVALTLHHILPRYIFREIQDEERRYFLDGKNSYWLCDKCHAKYENNATQFRTNLLYKLNYVRQQEDKFIKDANAVKIKNLCRFMTGKFHTNIYNYSIYEAYNFVKSFYDKKYLTYDTILNLSEMRDTIYNPNYLTYGKFLITVMPVKELDFLYRKNFIKFLNREKVQPEYVIPQINEYYEKS